MIERDNTRKMWRMDAQTSNHDGSNRLSASWTHVRRRCLFILALLLNREVFAPALIIRINQFFHLDAVQAVDPPIERDVVHKQSRAVLRPRCTRIQFHPLACLTHGLDVPYNPVLAAPDDWCAGQGEKVRGYPPDSCWRDIQKFSGAFFGCFLRDITIFVEAA